MVDMDEFVYIVNGTLKDYLVNNKFNKCDFIRLHWVSTNDNGLLLKYCIIKEKSKDNRAKSLFFLNSIKKINNK